MARRKTWRAGKVNEIMNNKAELIIESMESELRDALREHNRLSDEWFLANRRIESLKRDLLRAYLTQADALAQRAGAQ